MRKRDRELQEEILENLKSIDTTLQSIFGFLIEFFETTKSYQKQVLEDLKDNE